MKFRFERILLLIPGLFLTCATFAQQTYPISDFHGEEIATCSGVFTDPSLGDSLIHYGPDEQYHIVFTGDDPGRSYLVFFFEMFSLGPGDTLYVHDGTDGSAPLLTEATHQSLSKSTVVAASGSLYFRFVSSGFDPDNPEDTEERLGWIAAIRCASKCELFEAWIDPVDGLEHCPDDPEPVSFTGHASYVPDNVDYIPEDFVYTWNIDDQEFAGQEVSYLFEDPGAYTIRLTVFDPVNECTATALQVLFVSTVPDLSRTRSSVETACAEEPFTLFGEAIPVVWTGFPTTVEEDPPFLIGVEDAYHYASTLTFDVFPEGMEVLSADDFDAVCVYVEHVDQSQLRFELEAPNGTVVELKAFNGPTANLGEPVVWEDDIPGTPYSYCFSPLPQYGTMAETNPQFHEYTDNAGNYYFNAAYMPPGNYTPEESLHSFAGTTMNGDWTLRVEDHTLGETGHVFGWSLLFLEEYYPDSLIFIPEIVEEQWYRNGTPLAGNPATTSLSEAGDYTFRFEVTDNFGCTFDTTLTVQILPLPEAEIVSELEIPVCEGDSTLLTVQPIDNDGIDWLYQWQVAGVDMPGRTYDTLMVKEPGLYTVMITDTITGCIAFFDKDVTDQNCDLVIPNVFTPNADGINDLFEIENLEHYPNAQMVIYNRWGKKVFEHNDYYNNWWDRNSAPDGTYIYVLRYTRMGRTRYTEGTITIIR